jgi:AcrR family transcriptional regulator
MARDGVAALSLSEVARRMGIRSPSLYKYFPSKLSVYDRLFRSGSDRLLSTFRDAAAATEPGLAALIAGFEATGRFMMDNPVLAQLLQWRPVPGFEPSAEAFAPNREFVAEVNSVVADAVGRGQLHADAATERGLTVLSILISGILTQQLANDPKATFAEGRYTVLTRDVLAMFERTYAPDGGRS